jgi:hypothetical protein
VFLHTILFRLFFTAMRTAYFFFPGHEATENEEHLDAVPLKTRVRHSSINVPIQFLGEGIGTPTSEDLGFS